MSPGLALKKTIGQSVVSGWQVTGADRSNEGEVMTDVVFGHSEEIDWD